MPPKKKGGGKEEEEVVMLGRPGNNVKMGIVGLPNVGKSSFFNALCKLNVAAENFPFCTIDPNVARVPVPDARFDDLITKFNPKSKVPAVLTVTDIAGLVKGASEGAGLGNAFLSHIAAVDGIYHMIRVFDDDEVVHVEGSVDPVRDLQIIRDELLKKDLDNITAACEAREKNVQRKVGGKEAAAEFEDLCAIRECLEANREVRVGTWTARQIETLNRFGCLTAKPVCYLLNLSERDYKRKRNKHLTAIAEWVAEHDPGAKIIPLSVELETNLVAMGEEGAASYMEENKVRSVLPKVIKTGYNMLRLINFFTVGEDEVKAWTVRQGCLAPQAAGTIHTDFEKGFICAEVYAYDTLKELETVTAVKAAGKVRTEGKAYKVKDGDCIFFKFNAAGGAGKKR